MRIDCHNHSMFSKDARYSISAMVKAAAEKEIQVFAITDHCDLDEYEKNRLEETLPQSLAAIQEEQEKFETVCLLSGIELGQPLKAPDKIESVLERYSFDYVIGALHSLKEEPDFYFIKYSALTDREVYALLERYYREVYELAVWNRFDSLAHITYPYRYIFRAFQETGRKLDTDRFTDAAAEIFKVLIQNGKALENNSRSFITGGEDFALNLKYMELYKALGGELVTVGSDAHVPSAVGRGINEGYAFLKEIGYRYVTYFETRKPVSVLL